MGSNSSSMVIYTSLIIVLLTFFIALNSTMSDTQKIGFKKGIGEIQNAFGFRGGFGLFHYMKQLDSRQKSSSPVQERKNKTIFLGRSSWDNRGQGNVATLWEKFTDRDKIRVFISGDTTFENKISSETSTILDNIGMGCFLFDGHIRIENCMKNVENSQKYQRNSSAKITAIFLYLHHTWNIPFSRMQSFEYVQQPHEKAGWYCSFYFP